MNDLATAPTADLIAEWVNAKLFLSDQVRLSADSEKWNAKKPHILDRKAAIAAELDRRCINANMESDGKGNLKTPCKIELPLAEFCLLCEWLLLKEGGKGA